MNKNKAIINIFEDQVCLRAKEKLAQQELIENHIRERNEVLTKAKEGIRKCLIAGICPDCGGELRYRPSFNPCEWTCLVPGYFMYCIKICICKDCGSKKKLLY